MNLNGKKCSAVVSCDSSCDEINNQSKNKWNSTFDVGWTAFPRKVQPLPKVCIKIACYVSW
jgi:hypothetical protein